jgi:hypothetical protein
VPQASLDRSGVLVDTTWTGLRCSSSDKEVVWGNETNAIRPSPCIPNSDTHWSVQVGKKCTFCFGPETVREVRQVGLNKRGSNRKLLFLDWLGTADKMAVRLAPVPQVDQMPQVRVLDCSQAVKWPSGLAGRLSKLVPITNDRSPGSPIELTAFLRSHRSKRAIKGAKGPSAFGWHSW